MVYKNWWKILGVLITFYVIIAGFLVPLNPGIVRVSPSRVQAGSVAALEVTGYNTRYDQDIDQIRAWLKLDDGHALKANDISVISPRHLNVRFEIPPFLPTDGRIKDAVLVIDHPPSGMALLPSAVFISQDSMRSDQREDIWKDEITDLSIQTGFRFPFRNILQETIRNTYFHVAIWFAMFILLITSVVYSVKYLRYPTPDRDIIASNLVRVGILFGILGVATGSLWAKSTWGTYWTNDTKLNMTAVSLLIYMAYLVLRQSIINDEQKARVSAIYNIFAFAAMIPLLFVVPRLNDSLHPGNGGNPALGGEDLDHTMRMVFYPAIIGYTLLGLWISELSVRFERLRRIKDYGDEK
jgi:heme exporter protein C